MLLYTVYTVLLHATEYCTTEYTDIMITVSSLLKVLTIAYRLMY